MGSSKWKEVKQALGVNLCVFGPTNNHVADNDDFTPPPSERCSDAALLPIHASNRLRLSKSLSRSSSKTTCSICLTSMRRGDGHAIFTAECSHSFHFQCIASNVKHGNQICPVCRAKWKEIPFQGPSLESSPDKSRITPVDWTQNNDMMTIIRRLPPRSNSTGHVEQVTEPAIFNDDEPLDHEIDSTSKNHSSLSPAGFDGIRKVHIAMYTEVSSLPRSNTVDSFTVLLHLKAPVSNSWPNVSKNDVMKTPQMFHTRRAPVDLITVLDISGSMAGTKLALLKRAMSFVIQNLGSNDRLSVIAFSSTARRLFPLHKMSEAGQQQALQAVNSLVANGGTNIAEGLRKGAKVLEDRTEKNPVADIILLSDGQDTYTVNYTGGNQNQANYKLFVPLLILPDQASGFKSPVHTFGFGSDHDASFMHSISEISGGTFSFIETEGVIQDAFAQCIGGLLSVVVKDLHIRIETVNPTISIGSLKAGSYLKRILSDRRIGSIDIGDLYADEERDFLVSVNIPAEESCDNTSLLKVSCVYKNPLTKEAVTLETEEVRIKRTDVALIEDISIEVDRQQNRIQAAEAMVEARAAAENGDLTGAVTILENVRKVLSDTVSAKSHDRLCIALDSELKEMQDRMASRHVYEALGRAYILSGLSSHSWQRATARGDSTDSSSLLQAYQTPSMVEMVSRSQEMLLGSPSAQRLLQPAWPFATQPKPR